MSHGKHGTMSLYTATCLVVANMVGIGVFTSLGFQLAGGLTPFVILMLWLVGGVCAFCGSVAYAELAAALPRSGGEYHFLARIFHPSVGFLAGWAAITAGFAAPVALAAMAFGKYIHGVRPALPEMPLAFAALGAITIAMIASAHLRQWFQNFSTSLKLLTILAFLAAGFLAPATGSALTPQPGDTVRIFSPEFATSLIYVMFAYAGWNASSYVTGEVRNPSRNVPLSMALGTILVTVLYIALNAVFLRVAPAAELTGKIEVGLIAGTYALGATGGKWMALLIAGGLLSTVGAMQWIGPRVLATMGEDNRALRPFSLVNASGIPIFATLAQTAIVILLLATGTFKNVLIYVQFTITLCSFLAVLGVFVLRWREPALPRPVRAWGYPLTPVIFLAVNAWMLWHVFLNTPRESFAGLATLLAGLVVFHLSERWKDVAPSILRGSLGFAAVSVAAFSVWAFGDLWFHHHGGEAAMYPACFLTFVVLSAVLLHPLLVGPRSVWRFCKLFVPAFLAYAVAWSAAWFGIGAGIGEWVASLAGSFAFAAVPAILLGNGRALLPSTLVLFVGHSAGYFLGEWVCNVSLHGVLSELIWGLLYGLGFGAGIGHAFWAMQRRE